MEKGLSTIRDILLRLGLLDVGNVPSDDAMINDIFVPILVDTNSTENTIRTIPTTTDSPTVCTSENQLFNIVDSGVLLGVEDSHDELLENIEVVNQVMEEMGKEKSDPDGCRVA